MNLVMLMVMSLLLLGCDNTTNPYEKCPEPVAPTTIVEVQPYDVLTDQDKLISFMMHRNYKLYPQLANLIVKASEDASEKYGIPQLVIISTIDIESDYRPSIVSSAGAVGLMQVLPKVWTEKKDFDKNLINAGIVKNKKELYDPYKNIMAGTYILKHYYDIAVKDGKKNPLDIALTRYLGGTKNEHYANLVKSLGEYVVYTINMDPKE